MALERFDRHRFRGPLIAFATALLATGCGSSSSALEHFRVSFVFRSVPTAVKELTVDVIYPEPGKVYHKDGSPFCAGKPVVGDFTFRDRGLRTLTLRIVARHSIGEPGDDRELVENQAASARIVAAPRLSENRSNELFWCVFDEWDSLTEADFDVRVTSAVNDRGDPVAELPSIAAQEVLPVVDPENTTTTSTVPMFAWYDVVIGVTNDVGPLGTLQFYVCATVQDAILKSCSVLKPAGFVSSDRSPDDGCLTFSMQWLNGADTPFDVLSCEYGARGPVEPWDIGIVLTDAAWVADDAPPEDPVMAVTRISDSYDDPDDLTARPR